MEKYDYLKKYITNEDNNSEANTFYIISKEEVQKEEIRIGFRFPDALKDFWYAVGYGFLTASINNDHTSDYINRISSPDQIASIILEEEDAPIIPGVSEYFEEGDIPFFEIMICQQFSGQFFTHIFVFFRIVLVIDNR
ncbi:hypothetical protein [Rickettsia endosymbiont of Orchestes rusci]|uniref:hypothetical protein n=1 Tax=Rickettsia endosymbiont of Orchestes rusci TaxID=3066250 RepID=UPI00313C98D3